MPSVSGEVAVQIVPVIDLKGGIVVHARRGQRAAYAPLRSSLVSGCEPVAVARALCRVCRTDRLYVADLDALAGQPANVAALRDLAAVAEVWVDAGATSATRAEQLGELGVGRNVVGTESLGVCAENEAYPPSAPPRVLSVDLREGRLVSPAPDLAGRPATTAAPLAAALGVRELVVIDLARVGSGSGPPLPAVSALAAALPGLDIYAGGGVRNDDDLRALASAGATGALVATALHDGTITPRRR